MGLANLSTKKLSSPTEEELCKKNTGNYSNFKSINV